MSWWTEILEVADGGRELRRYEQIELSVSCCSIEESASSPSAGT